MLLSWPDPESEQSNKDEKSMSRGEWPSVDHTACANNWERWLCTAKFWSSCYWEQSGLKGKTYTALVLVLVVELFSTTRPWIALPNIQHFCFSVVIISAESLYFFRQGSYSTCIWYAFIPMHPLSTPHTLPSHTNAPFHPSQVVQVYQWRWWVSCLASLLTTTLFVWLTSLPCHRVGRWVVSSTTCMSSVLSTVVAS